MATARSRCPFLRGSRSDSVIRNVMELMFLSDQSRSNTTVTLMIDNKNQRISGDGAFGIMIDKIETLLLHGRPFPYPRR